MEAADCQDNLERLVLLDPVEMLAHKECLVSRVQQAELVLLARVALRDRPDYQAVLDHQDCLEALVLPD